MTQFLRVYLTTYESYRLIRKEKPRISSSLFSAMGVYSTGLAAGGGLGQGSGGGSWYGIRLGGILWSRSSIQGEGQGHLKFLDEPVLPNEGQTYTADIYNTEEARSCELFKFMVTPNFVTL